MALLQPAPETYELFDDVMLLVEGCLLYHGPQIDILDFFASLGLAPPARADIPGFLVQVVSKRDQEV